MGRIKIILSAGSIPWLGVNQAIEFSERIGYDGLEILPTRLIVSEMNHAIKLNGEDKWVDSFINLKSIKSIHQNWRFDIGLDKKYGIGFLWSVFFNVVRYLLFPAIDKSQEILEIISRKLQIPIVVHDISKRWTDYNREFSGGILYEIIGKDIRKPREIEEWLKGRKHKVVLDTRDDQSLLWAKANKLNNWKYFWQWVRVENIGGIQVTLIGRKGIEKILHKKDDLLKEYLLWLCKNNWVGTITIEVNPLMLFILKKGKFKQGLREIADFIREIIEK